MTANEVRKSHDNVVELDKFLYLSGTFDVGDAPQLQKCVHFIPAILAFDSVLIGRGKTEIERYDEISGCGIPAVKSFFLLAEDIGT